MRKSSILVFLVLFGRLLPAQGQENQHFPKQKQIAGQLPAQHNVWVFLLAGQSNMAGRGFVEPQDTLPDARILTVNQNGEIILAKEPLHYYEPGRTGLDCGLSFARTLLPSLPDSVSLLILPTAIGGSSIQQWLGDSLYRGVKLLSNAKEKIALALRIGVLKGILWHQGESNSNTDRDIALHAGRLTALVDSFRTIAANDQLPLLLAELGSFSKNPEGFRKLNEQLLTFTQTDNNTALIKTGDLNDKGDNLHFNSQGQRIMGQRFAEAYVSKFLPRAFRTLSRGPAHEDE